MASSDNFNGGAVVAMQGKDCLAVATDHRFGMKMQTTGEQCKKVYNVGQRLFLGLTGLQADMSTVYNRIMFRKGAFEARSGLEITPKMFSNMLSNLLYEHRFGPFFIEPVVVGMHPQTLKPYMCAMDLIGCPIVSNDFVVAGTCSCQLIGMCESLWRPNMNPQQLFDAIGQVMMHSFNRDAVSGFGASIFILEKDKITERLIRTRMD